MAKGRKRNTPSTADLTRRNPPPAAASQEEVRLTAALPLGSLNRETLAWILLGFFALFVLGFYLMRIPGTAEGNPLGFDRAVFSALAAVTLTGLRQDVSVSPFAGSTAFVPVTLLILTLGGSYLTLLATSMPACRVLGLPHSTKKIAAGAGILVGAGTLLGTLILLLGDTRGVGSGDAWLEALVKSASAIGNSGVYWGSIPRADAATTQLGLLPLAIIGGFGLPVILDLHDRITGRTPGLAFHTKLVLVLAAGAYAVGVIVLLICNDRFLETLWSGLRGGGWTPSQSLELRQTFVSSAVLSIEARSAAFPSVSVASLPRAANWALLLLMAVGTSPAGTGGGLKTTTFFLLGRGMKQGLAGERPAPATGYAIAWLTSFLAIVFVGYGVLLWSAPEVPSERLLTAAVSATSNCGLTHDALSIVRLPLFTLGLMMALGRIVPILLVWRMAERLDFSETIPG